MDIQQSLDHLTTELQRRGLPRAYIERLVSELDDHIEDLIDERRSGMSMDANRHFDLQERIGSTGTLAAQTALEYRRRTFWGRHPILTFLVAPIPVMLLTWIGCIFASFFFAQGVPWLLGDAYRFEGRIASEWPLPLFGIAWGLMYLVTVAPPLIAVTLFCWLARRSQVSWRWVSCAVLLVALLGGLYHCQMEAPYAPGQGRLTIGFGTAGHATQVLQFLLPLAVATWFALRAAAQRQQHQPEPPRREAPLPLPRAA